MSFQSRIKSKGIFSDELAILEKVNKEKAVFFKELSGECQKDRLSHIARSLAVKGLVDLCVTKRKASRKSRSDFMLVSPEKEKVKLEAILQNPKVLEKAYDDYLEELREISPHAQVLPYKMKVPHTLEEFRQSLKEKLLYLCKRGLPKKNMKAEGVTSNEKGLAFEVFIKQTLINIVEKMNKREISPAEALEEITKFKEECYAKFNELLISSSRLEHGKRHDPQDSPGGREGNIEQIDQRKAQ
ncbi:hypothetical protein DMNBHIDG_01205 [Candidatus Methanoperedenaceae archaeon GB37]|nr:hypothetical protein DMNBHIDG_01205 [Candidatus Methanoperedenaceae archaeon GB37]